MPKKCPPGVICFENITLVLFLIIACIIIYLAYTQLLLLIQSSGISLIINSISFKEDLLK